LDNILDKALVTPNYSERVALYKQAQKIITSEAPWIFINYATALRPVAKRVHGMVPESRQVV